MNTNKHIPKQTIKKHTYIYIQIQPNTHKRIPNQKHTNTHTKQYSNTYEHTL